MSRTFSSTGHERLVKFLKQQRKQAGLTQTQVAKRLRRYQSFVTAYESGQKRVDVIELVEIAKAVGFDPQLALQAVTGQFQSSNEKLHLASRKLPNSMQEQLERASATGDKKFLKRVMRNQELMLALDAVRKQRERLKTQEETLQREADTVLAKRYPVLKTTKRKQWERLKTQEETLQREVDAVLAKRYPVLKTIKRHGIHGPNLRKEPRR